MSILHSLFQNRGPASGPVEYIIVGLGNPGIKYEKTRHNAGFMVMDALAEKHGTDIKRMKFKALCGDAEIEGKRTLLMKPQTFMNNSGEAVQEAMAFYKIPAQQVIVIFDDISLAPGRMRIRKKGSDGGHNGIKSIIHLIGSEAFPRIKIGVGAKPNPQWDLANLVLSEFSSEDQKSLRQAIVHACEACGLMVTGQTEKAMNLFNS